MANVLAGLNIAIAEARFSEEFGLLFERAGARVRRCPLQTETLLEDQSSTRTFIDMTIDDRFDWVIFMTGIGVRLILQQAEAQNHRDALLKALERVSILSRGSKSTAALRQANVRIDVIPQAATSEGIIEALRHRDLQHKSVAVQLYGEPNPKLCSALESFGASVLPISVYAYQSASDTNEIERFIREIISGDIHILVFTSASQVRALFEAANGMGFETTLRDALTNRVRIASIGEVTTRALNQYGLQPRIVPEKPKMGAMVKAICTIPSF